MGLFILQGQLHVLYIPRHEFSFKRLDFKLIHLKWLDGRAVMAGKSAHMGQNQLEMLTPNPH